MQITITLPEDRERLPELIMFLQGVAGARSASNQTVPVDHQPDRPAAPQLTVSSTQVRGSVAITGVDAVPDGTYEVEPKADVKSMFSTNAKSLFDAAPKQEAAVGSNTPAAASADVDEKGVPFNPKFCARAKEPFYASGKKKGQWKKGKNVDEDDYDDWYADQQPGEGGTHFPAGNPTAGAAQAGPVSTPPQQHAPQESIDVAGLMSWLAENEANGSLPGGASTRGFSELGLSTQDLFPNKSTTSDQAQANVNRMFTWLKQELERHRHGG